MAQVVSGVVKDVKIVVRCRPWSGGNVQQARVLIQADGDVLVWDDVAGHYTRLHALGPRAIRRIRRLAGGAS